MDISGKKILVIGGAGFIGSHVVEELLKTDVGEVVIYDNFARGKKEYIKNSLEDDRCKLYPHGGDIREIDLLNDVMIGMDAVIHLAAMWLLHCKDFPRTAFDVNIQGTFNVLEACVKNNIKRLVYSSSASVYGDAIEVPMTESHPFNNRNFYGASKIAGEAMCRATYDRYGLNYVGLRYMNVYGPHQDQTAAYTGVVPIMLNKIDVNEPPIINGDGSQAYDFISVKDVARCNVLALQADVTDEFYNVGTGIQTTIKELCELILELKQSNLKVHYKPYTPEDARRMVQNRIGCAKKAKQDLQFECKYALKEGLIDLINWREHQ
ncbi:NAD-dependent epimerase/dehydratase family protein [Zooshikella ganghwensis]|uniref:NAD-dependent epimerase/dehydratase family protein n=1 Tax=Zooshikella ganghwensis TaxID=202772 RepID=A0A4P9VKY6_9GAMM|nr:NAD-dependent epimerase/dehydratase family protein [Zooshikella ganghwensis]RDH43199.1 NAD-dependent epimerase/dehydratase family protein [Zooshikella ganghwensis]